MKTLLTILALTIATAASPIRQHPSNPHWFEWNGKAIALITSAEHYGAVLNSDFDFRRYLETMQRDGMNYTCIFSGSYVEPQGAFGILRNTLAPAQGRFLAPWARGSEPGYAVGGNKFDLDYDNLLYEIQNEPWADNHVLGDYINPYLTDRRSYPNAVEITTADSIAWQRAIAQNVANFRLAVNDSDLVPKADLINFHYAYPEAVTWNRGLDRIIGYDETGFAGNADSTYLRQAWNFALSGGGLFNSLDYSFTVGREDGTHTANKAPGGGSPGLRASLKTLAGFLHSFDLQDTRPDPTVFRRSPGVVMRPLGSPSGSTRSTAQLFINRISIIQAVR